MGRNLKRVIADEGIDRRATGYYSTPSFVSDYIAKRLYQIRSDAKIALDPCVGMGEMTSALGRETKKIGIDILDMNPLCVDEFINEDFLELAGNDLAGSLFGQPLPNADIIIANPPYNCHETEYIRKNKKRLQEIFGRHTTLNMYSLFLSAIIRVAKPNTAIGLIVHDSFLTARGHEALRKLILSECEIHYIHLCPSDLFRNQGADVRTCILILTKGIKEKNEVFISPRPSSKEEFQRILAVGEFQSVARDKLCLIADIDRSEFLINAPTELIELFSEPRLGEMFPCITGISTGFDKKYISKTQSEEFAYPFYKNPGSRRFFSNPDGYMVSNFLDISKVIPNFIVRNKNYLFKEGISCSSMGVAFGAAILPKDATFGVNANIIVDESEKWWLLAYLNSSLCTYLVRSILLRSNMITAGYVSRIPLPSISASTRTELAELSKKAYNEKVSPKEATLYIRPIDQILFRDLSISEDTQNEIHRFCSDVIKNT